MWCCRQVKLCDPHLSVLEARFSGRGTIQIRHLLVLDPTGGEPSDHMHPEPKTKVGAYGKPTECLKNSVFFTHGHGSVGRWPLAKGLLSPIGSNPSISFQDILLKDRVDINHTLYLSKRSLAEVETQTKLRMFSVY